MAGIEKMTEAILADARKTAEEIINVAKSEADKEKSDAFDGIAADKEKQEEALKRELNDYRNRAESARDLSRRRMVLEKKQEIIAKIIEKTRVSLHDADTQTYFSNLYKMFEKYCQSDKGTMYLNARDLERLPGDFSDRIEAIAHSKSGEIVMDKNPMDIEDGFILVYGGTEENCTFRSLIESAKDDLYDEINKMLWRDA